MSKKSKKRQATSSPGPSEMADEKSRAPDLKEPGPSIAKKDDPEDASEQSRIGESFTIVTPSAAASPANRFGLQAESADGAGSAMKVDDFSVAQSGEPAPVIGSGPRARSIGDGIVPIEADDAKNLGLQVLNLSTVINKEEVLNPHIEEADMLDQGIEIPIIQLDELELLGEAPALPDQAPQPVEEPPAQVQQPPQIPQMPPAFPSPEHEEHHPFEAFYGTEDNDDLPKHPTAKAMAQITLQHIQRSRNATIQCIMAPDVIIERPDRAEAKAPAAFLERLNLEQDLIYAVLVKNFGGYWIATSCNREYCADDRGDLFTLIVNEYSYDFLTQAYTKITGLYVGDVITIRSIFRRQSFNAAQWSPIPLTSGTAINAFFVVGSFAVWKRHTTTPQPVAEVQSLRPGHRIPLVVFGITKMVLINPQVLRRQGRGQLFAVAFVPEVQPCQLLRKVRSGTPKAEVLHRTAAVACQWQLNPVLLSFQPGHRDVIRDLDISPMSFSHGLGEDVETHAQAFSTTFGVYGMVAMESKRKDLRYFHADLISVRTQGRRGTFCQFLLHTEEQTTHSRLWRRGTPLSVELPNGKCLNMTVTVAEQEPRRTRVGTRLQSPLIDLSNVDTVVIRQKPIERGDMARLAPRLRHIPKVSTENNAMRTLAAVSGANVLPDLEPFPVRHDNLTLEGFTLSEEQAKIIRTLSFDTFTALAVNCGPGTGKTTTLVLAVLSRMQNTGTISMMTAMSNGAVTAAVTELNDVDKSRRCRAVRLISNQNLSAIAEEHRTPLDYPTIWPEFLLNLVRRFDRRHEPLDRDVVDAAVYLCRSGKLNRTTLRRADLRTASNSKPVKNLVPLFFDLFFILGTCASVRSFFSKPDMSRFSDKVDLMLLDEASRLPRYAFTAA